MLSVTLLRLGTGTRATWAIAIGNPAPSTLANVLIRTNVRRSLAKHPVTMGVPEGVPIGSEVRVIKSKQCHPTELSVVVEMASV